jgi:hypothetical protein
MANGAGQLAGGAPPPQQVQVAPGNVQGGDQQLILQALQQAIQSSVDEQGFVDVAKLAQIWPQVAQGLGLNIPFETVLQMIQQNPEMISQLVEEMGLAGIIINGQRISPEQLAGIGSGAAGIPPQGGVQ